MLAFGVGMGFLSKLLDLTASNDLPALLQQLDVTNFLGRFTIWAFIGACIAIYSASPARAALNVLLFFVGMVGSYYLCSWLVGGFFPAGYAAVCFGIALLSPALAYVCWYAGGRGPVAIALSGIILGAIMAQAILLHQGIRITHVADALVWAAALFVLRRQPKEYAIVLAVSLAVVLLCQAFLPYFG